MIKTEILVVGGGLAGTTCALALARAGWDVNLCAPQPIGKDTRTTAFLWQTVEIFESLGLWEELAQIAFPLKTMRIVDATNRLIRALQTEFHASEIDLAAFGYNLVNWQILEVINRHIAQSDNIKILDQPVRSISKSDDGYLVQLEGDNEISSNILIGADGRNSLVRETLLPKVRQWSYPQEAIVLDFEHEFPSNYVSTEFHTETGPFTIVPQSQTRAGLVWMERPERVTEILSETPSNIGQLLETQMQSFLGKITLANEPRSFPISGIVASRFGDDNAMIIGEAAHVFPPIGAQGFNLGARDIQTLLDVLKRHTNTENRGQRYDILRRGDIESRTFGVDMLNRSLLSDFIPGQIARSAGLYALKNISPLRKFAMKQGISPYTG